MNITYKELNYGQAGEVKDLVNHLMDYQQSLSYITPERFDAMSFESRMLPSMESADENFLVVALVNDQPIAYVYSNIAKKQTYESDFAVFFDMDSIAGNQVGCLSQFYIEDGYRNMGIGSELFNRSMHWLDTFPEINDRFIYVSNGNTKALNFYIHKGFKVSHDILDGFITVLRNL